MCVRVPLHAAYKMIHGWISVSLFLLISNVGATENGGIYENILIGYSSNGGINEGNIQNLLDTERSSGCKSHLSPADSEQGLCGANLNTTECQLSKCLTASEILMLFDGDYNETESRQALAGMVLYQATKESCKEPCHSEPVKGNRPPAEVWGYGLLSVTLINTCALLGLLFVPIMKKSWFQRFLMFMVAMAVGTLTGAALFVLIPECFDLLSEESPLGSLYLWRAVTISGGLYLFFITERLLRIFNKKKKKNGQNVIMTTMSSMPMDAVHRPDSGNMRFDPPDVNMDHLSCATMSTSASKTDLVLKSNEKANDIPETVNNGQSYRVDLASDGEDKQISFVAWMVIIGDALHNFVDGLSIGAAFSISPLTGLSISLAIVCEELPHELGDFAILLNAGMSIKQALGLNFLSACSCYIGLVIGILVGELEQGTYWIFAIAGGMFLYISLVDMLPEVNYSAEKEQEQTGSVWPLFLIHNSGLLFGFAIILLLGLYGENISI